jgi:hypothetical protein
MVAGLRIKDENGHVILEVTDRLQRKIGEVAIPTGASGSVTVTGGDPWYYVASNGSTGSSGSEYAPVVTISGGTISWAPNTAAGLGQVPVVLVYGAW